MHAINRFQADVHCVLKFISLQTANDSDTQAFVPYSKRFCCFRYTCGERGERAVTRLSITSYLGAIVCDVAREQRSVVAVAPAMAGTYGVLPTFEIVATLNCKGAGRQILRQGRQILCW